MDVVSIADSAPGSEAWFGLCASLDELADEQLSELLADLDARLSLWPDVVRVAPRTWAASLVTREPNPRLAVVRQVGFGGQWEIAIGGDELRTICAHLSELAITGLDFSWQRFGVRALAVFLKHLPADHCVRRLDLGGAFHEGITGIETLASCEKLANLDELVLDRCKVTDAGLGALVADPVFRRLRSLSLDGQATAKKRRISDGGALRLSRSSIADGLRVLRLPRNSITGRGAQDLLVGCRRLEVLDLGSNHALDVAMLKRFGRHPRFSQLTSVDVEFFPRDLREAAFEVPALLVLDPEAPKPEGASARFAELRADLAGDDLRRWDRIAEKLAEWPDDESLDAAIDYVVEHVADWPDHHRPVSVFWRDSLLTRHPNVRARVGRHLALPQYWSPSEEERTCFDENWARFGFTSLSWQDGAAAAAHRELWPNVRLPGLRRLELADLQKVTIARAVAASPALADVEVLIGRGLGMPQGSLDALLRTRSLASLEWLSLNHTYCGDHVLTLLAEATWLARLSTLELDRCGLSSLAPLESAGHLGELRRLSLAYNQITTGSIGPTLASPQFQRLEHLSLSGNELDETTLSLGYLPALVELDLSGTELYPGWGGVFDRSHLPAVRCLVFRYNPGADRADVAALVTAPFMENLRILELTDTMFDDTSLAPLGAALGEMIEVVGVGGCGVGDEFVESLLSRPRPHLRALYLNENRVSPDGLAALAAAELPALEVLRIWGNVVDDESVIALVEAQGLPALTRLQVGLDSLSSRALVALHNSDRIDEHLRDEIARHLGVAD